MRKRAPTRVPTRVPIAAGLRRGYAVNRARHRLRGVKFLPSPHYDTRPKSTDISLLVVHAISLPPGKFGGPWIHRLFAGTIDARAQSRFGIRDAEVSAHLCIFRDGRTTQYVPFNRRAWHAGKSMFENRGRCNDFSIGIELEGCDDQPFEPLQYRVLARIARALMMAYPRITPARIAGHSDIAPGRKTDPGPHFDWPRFHSELELLT